MKTIITPETLKMICDDNTMLCDSLTLLKECIFQEIKSDDIIEMIDQTIFDHNKMMKNIERSSYYNSVLENTPVISDSVQ